jgi:hypothetical protein
LKKNKVDGLKIFTFDKNESDELSLYVFSVGRSLLVTVAPAVRIVGIIAAAHWVRVKK